MSENKNLPEKSMADEFQEDMMKTLIETLLPKIKPAIKPATKKFTEFMQDGNMIVAKVVGGKVFFFHIKEANVEAFEMKEGTKPEASFDLEGFIGKILSGDFSI